MKKLLLLLLTATICGSAIAQPDKWLKKASKAVFTLKTFDSEGTLLSSSNGFFISTDGVAVSPFSPFRGAERAVIIDASGKEYNVNSIIGANDIYDVAKFKVDINKCTMLKMATATTNSSAWLLPYNAKTTVQCSAAKVTSVQKINGDYDYFTLSGSVPENNVGCPYLNTAGDVVGILQPAADNKDKQYAVAPQFVADMKMTGISMNDATLRATAIRKALPDDIEQANIALYLCSTIGDAKSFIGMVDDYLVKFPDSPEGYSYKAQIMSAEENYPEADKYMQLAIGKADDKAEAHYNYARMIYQNMVYFKEKAGHIWSFDKALAEAEQAVSIDPQGLYIKQKGDILFSSEKYAEALNCYNELMTKGQKTAEVYYAAARCMEMTGDTVQYITMLDSAVATFSQPYLKEAAPYILARAQALAAMSQWRKAINDYNEYEKLMIAQVGGNFYYTKALAETNGRLFKQALDDLDTAISKEPTNLLYLAEKASLLIRVRMIDEAMVTAQECINIDPNASDGYLFLGLAQCLKGNKEDGVKNLQLAKGLGDPQAEDLIKKYGK